MCTFSILVLPVRRYAMREALALIGEEGLEKLWEKHKRLHNELWAGLKEMGLEPFVEDEKERLVTVNCIKARTSLRLRASLSAFAHVARKRAEEHWERYLTVNLHPLFLHQCCAYMGQDDLLAHAILCSYSRYEAPATHHSMPRKQGTS